jgi:hypothetical protein
MNNSGITLTEVRSEAMNIIQMLKENKIEIKTAIEIRNLLGTVIDVAKTQVEFLKAIPNSMKEKLDADSIKAIAGTLRDRDTELDEALTEIDKKRTRKI